MRAMMKASGHAMDAYDELVLRLALQAMARFPRLVPGTARVFADAAMRGLTFQQAAAEAEQVIQKHNAH